MDKALLNLKSTRGDIILETALDYIKDKSNKKVNLSFGAIMAEDGNYYSFKSVNEAEKIVIEQYKDKPYIFTNGTKEFSILTQELLFGKNSKYMKEKRICTIQTIGGDGSIFLAIKFLKSLNIKCIYVTNSYYVTHVTMIKACDLTPKYLNFYDSNLGDINYDLFLNDLKNIEDGSCIILQTFACNPCSMNIKEEYFEEIIDIFLKKKHIVVFDVAYLCFGNSSLEKDVLLIRKFEENGIAFIVSQTFSKCMAIYGSRAGALHIICENKSQRQSVANKLCSIAEASYGTPSVHVNRVICEILRNEKLKSSWIKDLCELSEHINNKRILFLEKLEFHQKKYNLNYEWNKYKKQRGIFVYIPLIGKIFEKLRFYHIYIIHSGRINVSGITKDNVDYIADIICLCLSEL
ncbi:aspartate aminotransferase, putative [Plasmodium relictum]|uniref:Aspartate aminotransferase, putative n=1 Tax=Plasmodium relictum TaxID=85471 RepID=A0A1J1GNV8_PLARL|nr:aspartate aminotransferase, putative [Plasmodium relictum]CRG84721.1 aspartate aminotransferase, putative [Plasmodium relictum]